MNPHFQFLRDVYFFKDCSDDDIDYLAQSCQVESFDTRSVVFYERDQADKFYVVMSGSVEIWKNYGSPEAVLLAVHGRGHIFGEMALVDDLDRSATVITHEPCEFIVFWHDKFEKIMQERNNVALSILRSLSSMVRRSNDVFIQNLSQQNRQLQLAYQELKAAQEELLKAERFSSLGKFASFILHDLRNPIAMIRGYAEMITFDAEKGSTLFDFATKIMHEADHVTRFANEILDYSRGEIRLNYVLTTCDTLFAKAKGYLNESFIKKGIKLDFVNHFSQPLIVDEERLLRVFINLADNARKACSSGGKVVFTASARDDNAVLTVTDNGEGMSPEVKNRVFEPFFSSSSKGGTGLGMLIVKNVVEAHGGTIQIDSEQGKGTVIRIELPAKPEGG